jgi:O-antigen ligase
MANVLPPAVRVLLATALLGFLTVLIFPADPPPLFGPQGFGWASWCYAFGVPVLAIALASGSTLGSRLLWPTAAYFACIAITGFFAVDRANTALEAAKLFGIVLAAFALAWLTRQGHRWTTLALVWLALLISVVQVLAFMNHVEYGLAERITVYVLPAGWSGYPELGPLVCVQFAVVLAVMVTAHTWVVRVTAMALLAVTVAEAAFLYSRLAWVAMAVLFVGIGATVGLRRRNLAPLALTGLAVAAVVFAALSLSPTFRQLASGVTTGAFGGAGVVEGVTLNVANLDARTILWERTGRMIRDHWGVGVGLGNFREVYESNYNPDPNDDGRRGVHAHNAFLQQAAELGVVGGLAFVALWGLAFYLAAVGGGQARGQGEIATAACLVALLVQNLGENLLSEFSGPRGRLTSLTWIVLLLASAGPGRGASPHGADADGAPPLPLTGPSVGSGGAPPG